MNIVTDPLHMLAHDHRELNGLLVAVHEALARIDRGQSRLEDESHEIRDGIEVFREALLEHFGHEQEEILPFVLSKLPDARDKIDLLIAEHDRIAEVMTALVKLLGAGDTEIALPQLRSDLSRFDALYASHAKAELAFFAEVTRALATDKAATEQLRALLDEH